VQVPQNWSDRRAPGPRRTSVGSNSTPSPLRGCAQWRVGRRGVGRARLNLALEPLAWCDAPVSGANQGLAAGAGTGPASGCPPQVTDGRAAGPPQGWLNAAVLDAEHSTCSTTPNISAGTILSTFGDQCPTHGSKNDPGMPGLAERRGARGGAQHLLRKVDARLPGKGNSNFQTGPPNHHDDKVDSDQ